MQIDNHMVSPKNTTFEIEKSGKDTAVLGVGSFEQHSYHLPVETDFVIASKVSYEVARRIDAMFLNPLPYSVSLEHVGFSGTILLRPDTLKRVVRDIAESVSLWGIKYLLLLNFHGGNFILNPTAREWNMEGKAPIILLLDFYLGIKGMAPNLHAGEVETSLMLYFNPEVVRLDRAVDFIPEFGREDLTHFGMKGLTPGGVWGYATRATREKGKRWFEEGTKYLVERYTNLRRKLESVSGEMIWKRK